MIQRTVRIALATLITGQFAAIGYGQGGNLLNRAAAANQAAAQAQAQQRAQQRVQQRAQTQIQQRVQAQVQQRAQAQVQQRAQARLQQRVQGQIGRRLRGAAQTAVGAGRRMTRPPGQANRLDVNAGTRVRANANAPGMKLRTDSKIRVNGSGRLVVPGPALLGNGEVNVKYFDNVFGRFNPFRQPQPEANEQPAPSGQQPPQDASPTATAGDTSGGSEPTTEPAAGSRQRLAGIGAKQRGGLHAQIDLSKAVRLRRSEISAIRDHALATSNAQLMASADQMEQILDHFVEAQAGAEAQAQTTARSAAQTTARSASGTAANAQGTLKAGVNASATGQARQP